MNTGLFDVLHDAAEIQFLAVEQCVHVNLNRVIEEAIHQHRMIRVDLSGPLQEPGKHVVVVDDLHATATQDVGRPNQHWVADLMGDVAGLIERERSAVLGRRQIHICQYPTEGTPIFGEMNRLRRGPDDG